MTRKPTRRLRLIPLCAILLIAWVSAGHAFAADDLCPDIEAARNATPNDMAGVQADIERLTLCVERARLLKQLDDIAKAREAMLNPANTQFSSGQFNTGQFNTGLGAPIPPLPVSALPPLANNAANNGATNRAANTTGALSAQLRPGEVRVTTPAAMPLENARALAAQEWRVRKIWGQGGPGGANMRAQLSDGRGTLINVTKGDPLPDGAVIESVSAKGVTLSRTGKITDLSWEETSSASAALVTP